MSISECCLNKVVPVSPPNIARRGSGTLPSANRAPLSFDLYTAKRGLALLNSLAQQYGAGGKVPSFEYRNLWSATFPLALAHQAAVTQDGQVDYGSTAGYLPAMLEKEGDAYLCTLDLRPVVPLDCQAGGSDMLRTSPTAPVTFRMRLPKCKKEACALLDLPEGASWDELCLTAAIKVCRKPC